MKYFKFLLPIICGILLVSACDTIDFGSVNNDDDHIAKPDARSLMAAGMNQFLVETGRPYLIRPFLYVQYQSQFQYVDEQLYNNVAIPWAQYYLNELHPLKKVVEINSQDEVSQVTKSYGAPVNQIGVAKIFMALIWKRLTDSYGPIPYKNALKGSENLTPAYTSQEKVYKDLVSTVQNARDMLDPSKKGPVGDVIYGGNVKKWKKYANSFLLEMAVQMSGVAPSYAKGVFTEALNDPAGVIETIDDEFWYQYQAKPGASNPFSSLRGSDYNMSYSFTQALNGVANGDEITYSNTRYDKRLDILANDPSLPGEPYGRHTLSDNNVPPGIDPGQTFAKISENVQGASAPLPYMTAAYTYLNRAEAALPKSQGGLGWTSENAKAMFVKGVKMSYKTMEKHWDPDGSVTADGESFANARWGDAPHDQVIGEEKWVALYPMGYQAWAEWRRTGFPKLVPAMDATNPDGSIPTRFRYPSDEPGSNKQSYNEAVSKLSPAEDSNISEFWWEQ